MYNSSSWRTTCIAFCENFYMNRLDSKCPFESKSLILTDSEVLQRRHQVLPLFQKVRNFTILIDEGERVFHCVTSFTRQDWLASKCPCEAKFLFYSAVNTHKEQTKYYLLSSNRLTSSSFLEVLRLRFWSFGKLFIGISYLFRVLTT